MNRMEPIHQEKYDALYTLLEQKLLTRQKILKIEKQLSASILTRQVDSY